MFLQFIFFAGNNVFFEGLVQFYSTLNQSGLDFDLTGEFLITGSISLGVMDLFKLFISS